MILPPLLILLSLFCLDVLLDFLILLLLQLLLLFSALGYGWDIISLCISTDDGVDGSGGVRGDGCTNKLLLPNIVCLILLTDWNSLF